MERAPSHVLQSLVAVEAAAEDVLTDRQQLIELDRRRNKTREALRAVSQAAGQTRTWLCMGNMFLKLPNDNAKGLLQKDYDQLDKEISSLQKNLKPKVSRLRDLEHKEELKGFDLQPLSRQELDNIMDLA